MSLPVNSYRFLRSKLRASSFGDVSDDCKLLWMAPQMTMAHSLVGLNVDASPNTHSVLMQALTARFPGDLLPRVLGSQIGATLLLALLNNARNQKADTLLLRADGPGRAPWLAEFGTLLSTLAGNLGHLLAHAEVRSSSLPPSLPYIASNPHRRNRERERERERETERERAQPLRWPSLLPRISISPLPPVLREPHNRMTSSLGRSSLPSRTSCGTSSLRLH